MIEIEDRAVQAAFQRLIDVGQNPARYLPAIANTIKENTRLRFVSGTAPDGARWAPVKRGGAPLRNTSRLMNSVTYAVSGNTATVGVPFFWAAVHQFGATIHAKVARFLRFKVGNRWASKRSVTIPARPIFGIGADDRSQTIAILTRALVGG